MHPNQSAQTLCDHAIQQAQRLRLGIHEVAGATVLDFGIGSPEGANPRGGLAAGLLLARICLADLAEVMLEPSDPTQMAVENGVRVQTDHPLMACLGCQYAGWPVQTEKYFAIASGPMRMARGREEMLQHFPLLSGDTESGKQIFERVVGVLETDRLPDADVITEIAKQCHISPQNVTLCVAPVTSIAGCVQVVARSVETALHKMHAVGLDPSKVISASGFAPLAPPATDTVGGIGRTNDAILYGGRVTLWVDLPQAKIETLGGLVPSGSSKDYGKPFAEIFKSYNYDFYKVDPNLFSPASVTFVNANTGSTTQFGALDAEILRRSFGC